MGDAAALAELETHPQADLIRRCWDVALTYENVWEPMYGQWRLSSRFLDGPNAWGECDPDNADSMRRINVFTHRCDIPDWRTPAGRADDERRLEYMNELRMRHSQEKERER